MSSSDGQDNNGRGGSRKSGKRPAAFMFIDSSTKGQNAKPDKAVRSFVMHQARRNKPWSTRQRNAQSPNTDTASAPVHRARRPPSALDRAEERKSPVGSSWLNDLDPSPTAWNQVQVQPLGSPVSSVGGDSTTSRSASQPYSTPPSSHGSVCDVPNCHGDTCNHQAHALARRDGFALGVLDPFDCLAVKTDAKTSSLIDHFVNIISPRLIPVDLYQVSTVATTGWVARSLGDRTSAPFAYALLTSSALHLHGVGATDVENPLFYKAQAISEVNKLLSDPYSRVDDNNIAAVFMLLCLEESQIAHGNKSHDDAEWSEMQRAIHLNGLRTMIQQRGGLSGLSSNKCLQVFLLMHSIAHSIASFQQPYTTLLDSTGAPQKYDLPSFRSRPSSARVLRLFRNLKPNADLLDIVDDIVVFVGDLSAWYEDRRCLLDPLELQKHAYLLIYRLFHWYTREGEERTPLDQSICLGLLIFLVRAANGHDLAYKAIILLTVKKLRGALSKGSIFRWANSPDLLLWILTMGALAAQGTSEAGFFTQYCSVAFVDAGLSDTSNADELLERMKKCLWIPVLFDEDVKKLWIQTGLAKGVDETVHEIQEDGLLSPDLREDDVVGLLTSTRFFTKK